MVVYLIETEDSCLENWAVTTFSVWLSRSSYLETRFSKWKWKETEHFIVGFK